MENCIQKVYSPPYNPENNDLSEIFNQTIISCTIILLSLNEISDNLWNYAISLTKYLYNKVPHKSIKNKILDEIFTNEKT